MTLDSFYDLAELVNGSPNRGLVCFPFEEETSMSLSMKHKLSGSVCVFQAEISAYHDRELHMISPEDTSVECMLGTHTHYTKEGVGNSKYRVYQSMSSALYSLQVELHNWVNTCASQGFYPEEGDADFHAIYDGDYVLEAVQYAKEYEEKGEVGV